MRIAIVRQRYNPFGGAERFVERAMDALAARGTAVTIVSRRWDGAQDTDGPQWLRCDPFHVGRTWRDASFARAVCSATAGRGYDLVQSHERIACCDVYRAGDGVHRQWLDLRARTLGPLARIAQSLSPYHRYTLAAERRMFASPRLRAVICNAHLVRDAIVRHFGVDAARLHVIHNGVDLERFHPDLRDRHRAAERSRLGLPADAFVWLYVGSGFARKGVALLLEAFAQVRMPGRDRLVIVGADRHLARMRSAADRLGCGRDVTFTGGVRDVQPFYGMADWLVLPTLYDPFPNVAVEALASALPIITTTTCGAAEVVTPGANGFVCPPLDVGALADAMRRARQVDPATSRAAARQSVAHLSLDAMAGRLVDLYAHLLAS